MSVLDKNLLIKELLEQRILKDEKRLEYSKNELETALNDFRYAEVNKNIVEDKV